MLPPMPHKIRFHATVLRMLELISLLCMLHWTMHFFWTPIRLERQIYAVAQSSEPAPAVDYQHEVWVIAMALNALLLGLMRSQITAIQTAWQSQPPSLSGLAYLLPPLFLACLSLAVLVVAHLMTT